jgi:hypothetical protein
MQRFFSICICIYPAVVFASLADSAPVADCVWVTEFPLGSVTTGPQPLYAINGYNMAKSSVIPVNYQPEYSTQLSLRSGSNDLGTAGPIFSHQDIQTDYLMTHLGSNYTSGSYTARSFFLPISPQAHPADKRPMVPAHLAWTLFLAGCGSLTLRLMVDKWQNQPLGKLPD